MVVVGDQSREESGSKCTAQVVASTMNKPWSCLRHKRVFGLLLIFMPLVHVNINGIAHPC